jgi:hypothetical protein
MERETTGGDLFWIMSYHGRVEPLLGVGHWVWIWQVVISAET